MTPIAAARERSDSLHARIAGVIRRSVRDDLWALPEPDFDALAQTLFEHQFLSCAPYRAFCEGRGLTPSSFRSADEIPPVPTEVFKSVDLFAFPAEDAGITFLTSGTRFGGRGRHHLRDDRTYAASMGPWMDRLLLPGAGTGRRQIWVLAPPVAVAPESSLSHMLQWAHDRRGGPGSRFFWTPEGPDLSALRAALDSVGPGDPPVVLLSTARALQALLEASGGPWRLPSGSVVMETGGPKRSGMIFDRASFHQALSGAFGVPLSAVVSEYGMTELGSQGYSPSFLASVDSTAAARWHEPPADLHVFPPWCRVRALSTDDLSILPAGERGLLCFWDLANVDSVLCVLTADEGSVTEQGVRLFGRSAAATPRGCSLAVEELLGVRS